VTPGTTGGSTGDATRPLLVGARVTVRPGRPADVEPLRAILAEASVRQWWGEPSSADEVAEKLLGEVRTERLSDGEVLLVIDVDGAVAGGIEYFEETDPQYRHANIDIYVATGHQGRGVGTEAVALLARFLFERRGHHRLTIDPAVANTRAVRSYEKVGFRRVGVLREYERGPDGTFHDGLLMDLLRDELTGP
jgi:aminoglycoside 6'-N-acetyltransferase